MLAGKRLLISGIADSSSIAAAVAWAAADAGAEILLTAYPRDLPAAQLFATSLSGKAWVLPLDATLEGDLRKVESAIRERWGALDGALHAIAFAPRTALEGVLGVPAADVERAWRTSVWSYAGFGELVRSLAPPSGGALVGLDFDSSGAWPVYNWMGPCKAALRSLNGYLARDLGPHGVRANLVAAGPLKTRAANGIPGFETLLEIWRRQAPLAWDPCDAAVVADAVCFLLSDRGRGITGEVVHVDGGAHAMAGWPSPADGPSAGAVPSHLPSSLTASA